MPVLRRRTRERLDVLTFNDILALKCWPHFAERIESVTRARELWQRHRGRLLEQYLDGHLAGRRPGAWWAFEPGIPDELRAAPDDHDPRGVLAGDLAGWDARAEWEERRARWLIAEGHLSAAERLALLAEAEAAKEWLAKMAPHFPIDPWGAVRGRQRVAERAALLAGV
jgi:hypothetical protein